MVANKQKIINIAIIIIAVIALSLGGYFYYQLRILKTSPETIAKKEAIDLVSKVSKLYLLPSGEDPTVATVSDPEVLKSQSFFTQALKDDKVLIYTKAGKAILYRPSIDKIIETAPISNNSSTTQPEVKAPDTTANTPAAKTTTKKQ